MLYCNLSGLMAAKKVNISDVSRDTGISRTTLTSLYYNAFKGIQNDTLDTLCKYFNVTADKILVFSRYDINITVDDLNSDRINVEEQPGEVTVCVCFEISFGEVRKTIYTTGTLYLYWSAKSISLELDLEYCDPVDNEDEKNNAFLEKVLFSLPYEMKVYIEDKISNAVINTYESDFGGREIDIIYMNMSLLREAFDNGKHNTENE